MVNVDGYSMMHQKWQHFFADNHFSFFRHLTVAHPHAALVMGFYRNGKPLETMHEMAKILTEVRRELR